MSKLRKPALRWLARPPGKCQVPPSSRKKEFRPLTRKGRGWIEEQVR